MKNISNLDTLFKVINQCDGAVELSLPEGGSVNLKSKLSQYFSMATVFSNGNIKELDLTTHNDSDSRRLIQYMVQAADLIRMIRIPPQIPTRLSGCMMSRSERRVCRKHKAVIRP